MIQEHQRRPATRRILLVAGPRNGEMSALARSLKATETGPYRFKIVYDGDPGMDPAFWTETTASVHAVLFLSWRALPLRARRSSPGVRNLVYLHDSNRFDITNELAVETCEAMGAHMFIFESPSLEAAACPFVPETSSCPRFVCDGRGFASQNFTAPIGVALEGSSIPEPIRAPKIVRGPGEKPRILLLADVRGWAFSQNLLDLVKYLGSDFDFDIDYVAEIEKEHRLPDWNLYDLVYVAYHRWSVADLVPEERRVGCLRSRWLFVEEGRVTDADIDVVQAGVAFHTTCLASARELEGMASGVVFRNLTNPVDMDRFLDMTQVEGVVPTWCGNAQHFSGAAATDVKGFYSIFRPVVRKLHLNAAVAEYHTSRVPPDEMPAFYLRGSVYVAPSLYEGASNSIMEAMASGLVVITTDTGNHRDMREYALQHFGTSGIVIVPTRTQEAFAEALSEVAGMTVGGRRELGLVNRKTISEGFSWAAWAGRYRQFFLDALEAAG